MGIVGVPQTYSLLPECGAKQQEFHRAVDRTTLLQQGIIETFDVKVCQATLHTLENGLGGNRTGQKQPNSAVRM
jgi:hypothetical protein